MCGGHERLPYARGNGARLERRDCRAHPVEDDAEGLDHLAEILDPVQACGRERQIKLTGRGRLATMRKSATSVPGSLPTSRAGTDSPSASMTASSPSSGKASAAVTM